ncbi:MAG: hypothetical protein L0H79_04725 [Intrasporangium sp.]|uniref:AfsR/SARP family transcriptional regulator n=1 Tax=Intrasporangium sp. TaxID=1925024 RepID=UPI0026487988|nr:BTAD domain-containing putative transcriptional regulator [Intrasporangium sp.]MDN5795038.1 hypothetical protein [Intrasporangium sp.]
MSGCSSTCRLHLLGCFALHLDGASVELGGREERVLAVLALRGPQRRSVLAGTLWPDTTEERALSSLRAAVMRLRRTCEGLIDAGRSRISLGDEVTCDTVELGVRLDEVDRLGDVPWASTSEALAALGGRELLTGWYDDWVLEERDALQHRQIRGLESLAEVALMTGRAQLAGALAERAIGIEPLTDSAQELLIRAHLLGGNRAAAIQAYRSYARRLLRELGIRPSASMTELIGSTGFVARPVAARV